MPRQINLQPSRLERCSGRKTRQIRPSFIDDCNPKSARRWRGTADRSADSKAAGVAPLCLLDS